MSGSILLAALIAPVPAPPAAPANSTVDRNQAVQFATLVNFAGQKVREMYMADVTMRDLITGAIRGLYEEAGQKMPDETLLALKNAGESSTDLLNVLIDARVRIGSLPALSGPHSLIAAINGFKHATDPYCGLASPRINSYVSVDFDFGLGLELDGASGQRMSIYRIERGVATGVYPPTGMFGPVQKPDAVTSPASFPWRIRRIIPGGPAQRAGLHVGDLLTHLDGEEITAENANRLFAKLADPGQAIDPNTGRPLPVKRVLRFKRGTDRVIPVTIETQSYTPESVFGVVRNAEGKWDCLLDRDAKIGYIRLGAVEQDCEKQVMEMLAELEKQGCKALIFDLRWCPGGYVTPGTNIASLFLKSGDVIAQVSVKRSPNGIAPLPETYRANLPFAGKFTSVPMVVLVGSETTGGGELIAAALQDNGRCEVMGQRTAGRASIQQSTDVGFAQMQFKVTTGSTLRPNGKPRGRMPDSKPTDEWGIRPDPGLEVPVTPDVAAKVKSWAEEHALRPADSTTALPFDDPAKDPFRAAALAHLRKKLERSKDRN
jgi:C-terminal peptidase prc